LTPARTSSATSAEKRNRDRRRCGDGSAHDGNRDGNHVAHDVAQVEQAHHAEATAEAANVPADGAARAVEDGYCPHCHLLVDRGVGTHWPRQPLRCPHCRLLVGVGRGRPTPSAEPGARGSAAGVFAHDAKRAGGDGEVTQAEVRQAIREVAETAGQRPERLLMVDYQQITADDTEMPGLADVFAAYGSWKRARRAAADTR
jgi:hypothetical protein